MILFALILQYETPNSQNKKPMKMKERKKLKNNNKMKQINLYHNITYLLYSKEKKNIKFHRSAI